MLFVKIFSTFFSTRESFCNFFVLLLIFKLFTMNDVCTCGDTGYHWLADENQAEANCWECYYKAEEMHYIEAFEEIGADVKPCDEELPW